MDELAKHKCEACRSDAATVTDSELEELLSLIKEWEVFEQDSIPRLQRTFLFSDFAQALSFTNFVGEVAEQENHHPALLTEWGKVTVTWWTHKIKGLHKNDFICAAKTDKIFNKISERST